MAIREQYKGEVMPLDQNFEIPHKLVAEMRLRGPNHDDLRGLRVAWKNKEEEKFEFLPTDFIRFIQRKASMFLKAAEGADPSIKNELLNWALEELYDAREAIHQSQGNENEATRVRFQMLLPELEQQISDIEAQFN